MSTHTHGHQLLRDTVAAALPGPNGSVLDLDYLAADSVLQALDRKGYLILEPGSVTAVHALAEADHIELLHELGMQHRTDPVPNKAKEHAHKVLTRMRAKGAFYV